MDARHLEGMAHDLRYAARALWRSRTSTLLAALDLALAIGAGTAVFSVVDRILFRSLPYFQADRLVSIGMVAPIVPQEFLLGYDYFDWRNNPTPFESLGSWAAGVADCDLNDAQPIRLHCARIDSTLLRTLGTTLVAGRSFSSLDESPNAPVSRTSEMVTGASLLLRTLWNIQNQPLGIRSDHLVSATVTLGRASYPEAAQRLALFERVEQRLGHIPGVREVAVTNSLPPANGLAGSMLYAAIDVRGRPRFQEGTGGNIVFHSVTPSYFPALAIPILRGRPFTERDRDPGRNVVILSDTLARRMFPPGTHSGSRSNRAEWESG